MLMRFRGWLPARLAVMGMCWLLPLPAFAENRDPAEIGHAIWFMGVFTLFFGSVMSFAIWLLLVRLREGPPSAPEVSAHYPSLEKVWSKEARNHGAAPLVGDGEKT